MEGNGKGRIVVTRWVPFIGRQHDLVLWLIKVRLAIVYRHTTSKWVAILIIKDFVLFPLRTSSVARNGCDSSNIFTRSSLMTLKLPKYCTVREEKLLNIKPHWELSEKDLSLVENSSISSCYHTLIYDLGTLENIDDQLRNLRHVKCSMWLRN